MSQNLRRFVRCVYVLDAVVNRVDAEAWDNPSPCPEWTAREVLGHALAVVRLVGDAAAGAETRGPGPTETAGEDPLAAWAAARDHCLEALDTQGVLRAERDTPFGRIPVDSFLAGIYIDPLTHAWDLAIATGQPHGIAADLAAEAEATVAKIGDAIRGPGRMADPVPGDWHDPVQRFAAFTGRRP